MKPFSSWTNSGEIRFMDLINPKMSFDFLGGMFLSVFRRQHWMQNVHVLDSDAIKKTEIFSHFDNTFPHVKIFAHAFANSRAFFNEKPLNVCLTGAREWAPLEALVRSVRLIEALDEYKKNGLSSVAFWKCKNAALGNFLPHLVYMYLNKETSGYEYINAPRLILSNAL